MNRQKKKPCRTIVNGIFDGVHDLSHSLFSSLLSIQSHFHFSLILFAAVSISILLSNFFRFPVHTNTATIVDRIVSPHGCTHITQTCTSVWEFYLFIASFHSFVFIWHVGHKYERNILRAFQREKGIEESTIRKYKYKYTNLRFNLWSAIMQTKHYEHYLSDSVEKFKRFWQL